MTTNRILKTIAAPLLICCAIMLSQCKHKVDDKDGINSFLSLISLEVQNGQTDSLMNNFDLRKKSTIIKQLVNILCNKTGIAKNSTPIFKLALDMDNKTLEEGGPDITNATIPITLSRDTLSIQPTSTALSFKIKRVANSTYKIVDVDATKLIKEYVDFENMVRGKILSDKDIYSPQTLAAFKTAEELKAKYDSIPWFQHIGNKTYYFVVKGKMNLDEMLRKGTIPTYKMGMVDSAKKEIIPVDFDLIHNIGATFPNLAEVEKDNKRGFYTITGENVLPVEYDQVFPVNDDVHMALLRKGNDYYWWKKDRTVSEKDADIKIAEVLPRIQLYGKSARYNEKVMENVMEYNSRDYPGSIYIAPSYMVDWALLPKVQNFKNPLRRNVEYEDASELYELAFDGKTDNENWLSSVFYSIRDNYLGGREGLYEHKNVMVINKRSNRIYAHDLTSYLTEDEGGGFLTKGACNISRVRAINDTLYEIVVGSDTYHKLYDGSVISGAPEYHYLVLKNDKLVETRGERLFEFTKYIKMDDSYLTGCYMLVEDKTVNHVNTEMLRFMKNEIYAGYKYQFKDKKWADIFNQNPENEKLNANVDDSLTTIEKYNIAFINKKLNELNGKSKVLAAK